MPYSLSPKLFSQLRLLPGSKPSVDPLAGASSFTVEAWMLGGLGGSPPSGWKVLSLGQFGPTFPWSTFCAVIKALKNSVYWDSTLRLAIQLPAGSWTYVGKPDALLALQNCGA